jgi:hypothetical protein
MSKSCAVLPAYLLNRREVSCRLCWQDHGSIGRTMLTYDRVPNALYLCRDCRTPFRVEACPSPDDGYENVPCEDDEDEDSEYD